MEWDLTTGNEIFLGCTSNLVSSGVRSEIRWLVEHKHVTCLVITAGGVEEDIIKCLKPTYLGEFNANDAALRDSHVNRIGNLLVPNDNYVAFEDWLTPILNTMLDEQEASETALFNLKYQCRKKAEEEGTPMPNIEERPLTWSPSTFIARLGLEINDQSSICYWAQKNNIPIFCPALTDGSIGDMLSQFAFSAANRPTASHLTIDIGRDIHALNNIARRVALHDHKMGAIVLGGGLVKHHIMNACLQGGGADAAIYINTAQEYDGSDAGARPSEAVSWGKLKVDAQAVKVYGEATVYFPLLAAASWAYVEEEEVGPAEAEKLQKAYQHRLSERHS